MKTFRDIAVLNYNSATVDVYSIEIDNSYSEEDQIQDFLQGKGYKDSEIYWMEATNIEVRDNRNS